MHVLFWGLGFLLFPDLLNVSASTGRLLLNSSTGMYGYVALTAPPHVFPLTELFSNAGGGEAQNE